MNKNINQNNRRGFLSKMLLAGVGSVSLFTSSAFAKNKTTEVSALTEEQKDRLFFIYQEEKVARDVYIYLSKLYALESTFASIQLSEQRHIDAAEELCLKYDIDISMINENDYGYFEVPYLQDLYNQCIELGSESLLDALNVGVLIEETDIGTLTESITEMDMPDDIIHTYELLREGSYNHLESYQAAVARELS